MNHLNAVLLGAVLSVSGVAAAGENETNCRAARALIDAQLPDGWSWQRGSTQPALNVSGLVATALASRTKTCGGIDAVARYAEAAVQRHARGDFLYDPDVEALALASKLTGNGYYLAVAREAFTRRYEFANGDEIVERWFMLKRDVRLIGFEAASAIRAAISVGELDKAREIALASARTAPRWVEGWDPKGWATTSRGALLEALSLLPSDKPDARLMRLRQDLVHHLVLSQGRDGSWEDRNTQATAYAVRGLIASGENAAKSAARLGERWLRTTQLPDGAWATFGDDGDVIHEVTAEALLALR